MHLGLTDRQEHLAALSAANVDVLRIFIVHIDDRAKDSSAQYTPDLEEWSVGDYQDGILDKIDVFMQQAYQHGIKLNLVFHDRYSLGVWQKVMTHMHTMHRSTNSRTHLRSYR